MTVVNGTTITATTPAHAAGAVTVVVTVNGQSGSLATGFTYNGTVAIGFAQVAAAVPQTPTATVNVTYPGAQTAGDLNIVVVGWNDTTATVQTVKDSAGNNYRAAIGPTSGTGLRQSIYYAANIVGGANTVTVTFSQSAASPDVRILEYRGVTTLDVTAGASGSGTAANSGAATTTVANELIFGANTVATTTGAAGSGFTSRMITAPDGDIAEDKIVTTAGSNSATATLTSSGPWVMQMATFSAVSAAVPTVSSVSPNSGSTTGGTAVTITGTNFAAGATVTFGSAAATGVTVVNGTTITATTPVGSAGGVTVTVTNPGGQSGSLGSAFTYLAQPTVSSVSPNSGSTAGGTAVTITGTNFAAGAMVTFGGAAATNVAVTNSTTITATTPGGSAGAVTVTVTVSGQSGNLTSGFTYVVAPTVSSVSPNSGSTVGGTAVTITGTNFAAGATVTFGSAAATGVTVVNGTTITATTPAHAAGAVTVVVTVNGQSGSLATGFTYNGTVAIGFAQVAAAVPQTPTGTVNVTYPGAQTAGDLNIVVVGWNDTTATVQTVKDSAGNNYRAAIGPTSGTGLRQSIYYAANIVGGANTVTVTFSQSAASPDVRILEYRGVTTLDVTAGASGSGTAANSGAATTTVANELIFGANTVATTTGAAGSGFTSRVITAPDGDIAEDKIVTTAGSNSATATLTSSGPWVMQMATFSAVSAAVPTVSSVSPNSGSTTGGTAVTITGTNFAAGATVTFGSAAATGVTVVNGTTITATTPVGSAGGVTVTVTNPGGQSGSLGSAFTYLAQPTVSSVSPNSGSTAGGTAVTITGTNFAAGAMVTFGGAAATNVAVRNSTTITATTPGGSAGAVTVTVTVSGQSGNLTSGFTYVVAPTVSSVSPNSGSTVGGTAVTITGTNFAVGATVTFGGAAATNVSVANSTKITATTPAGSAGAVTVTVTVNGQSGSLASGFTYNGTVAIGFGQVAAATPQTTTATVAVSYPGAQTQGDLNVVVVGWNDTTATVQSVVDSAGNAYSLAIGPTSGTALRQSIYYAPNIKAGSNTVTVTFNQPAAFPDVRILEYRGVSTVDVTAGASGSGTAANSGAATTTVANELIFGANTVATTTGAAGSGFTSRVITAPDGDIAEDKIVTTAGSNSATATLTSSGPWVMQMVAFK